MSRRRVAVIVNAAAMQYTGCALANGAGLTAEFDRFVQIVRSLIPFGNRRFFRELAERPGSDSLLQIIFDLVSEPGDRELIKSEAEAAYSTGKTAVHPELLKVLAGIK